MLVACASRLHRIELVEVRKGSVIHTLDAEDLRAFQQALGSARVTAREVLAGPRWEGVVLRFGCEGQSDLVATVVGDRSLRLTTCTNGDSPGKGASGAASEIAIGQELVTRLDALIGDHQLSKEYRIQDRNLRALEEMLQGR